jgi:hypothetical protein
MSKMFKNVCHSTTLTILGQDERLLPAACHAPPF